MGKLKCDSDEEMGMDIEQPAQPVPKKNKLIAKKNRAEPIKRPSSAPPKVGVDVVRQFAKQVNLKTKSKSLDQKQSIFNKIVEGLKDKSGISKKSKKKTRILLKKVLIYFIYRS